MKVKVVVNVNDEAQALIPAPKTIYGELDLSVVEIANGSPLVIGKKYFTSGLIPGDDISNCGFVADYQDFIATQTTPTDWTNGTVIYLQNENVTTYQNNVDTNISVSKSSNNNLVRLKITNGGFVALKTMPNIIGGSNVEVLDSNTIEFNNQIGVKYFKIEVLN